MIVDAQEVLVHTLNSLCYHTFQDVLLFLNRKRSAHAPSNAHKLRRLDPRLKIEADDEMNRLLLIALLGLVPAISLAFSFDDNENQGKYTANKATRYDLDR